ncbi:MAG: trypsin-like serine protease, partial [Bacteriovoracaceae bacterium]|nr:trypsin-like serine protease [Bacteriovoracaceae bacterium]
MKIKHLVYLISLSIVLTGCGINNIEKTPYQQNQFKLKTAKEFSKYINEAELSEDTPNGLGLLIQRNASGDIMDTLGSCTWFLIDKDTAYTNSHCIPESLKEDRNLDCSQYIGGVFKTSIGQERRRCGKLIHFSKISEEDMDHPDYAIIKLNKSVTGSTDFDVSRSGFDDGEELGGHAVDTYYIEHDTDEDFSFYGSYKELNCLTYHKSIFGEFHEQRSAIIPIFSTEQSRRSCSVISGNSGSPATAAGTFTVKGIIFGGQKKDDDIIESDESLNLPEIETLGLLTNFRCMDL